MVQNLAMAMPEIMMFRTCFQPMHETTETQSMRYVESLTLSPTVARIKNVSGHVYISSKSGLDLIELLCLSVFTSLLILYISFLAKFVSYHDHQQS